MTYLCAWVSSRNLNSHEQLEWNPNTSDYYLICEFISFHWFNLSPGKFLQAFLIRYAGLKKLPLLVLHFKALLILCFCESDILNQG